MSKQPDKHDQLLSEIYHEDWSSGQMALLARKAAASARRRHTIKRATVPTLAAITLIAAFGLIQRGTVSNRTEMPTSTTHLYETISDTELLALTQDRPLLVIKNDNGTQDVLTLSF